jgi:hypothetical protein
MAYGKKVITEKKTGEKYGSKSEMRKHEKKESFGEMMKEYGLKKAKAKVKAKPKKK